MEEDILGHYIVTNENNEEETASDETKQVIKTYHLSTDLDQIADACLEDSVISGYSQAEIETQLSSKYDYGLPSEITKIEYKRSVYTDFYQVLKYPILNETPKEERLKEIFQEYPRLYINSNCSLYQDYVNETLNIPVVCKRSKAYYEWCPKTFKRRKNIRIKMKNPKTYKPTFLRKDFYYEGLNILYDRYYKIIYISNFAWIQKYFARTQLKSSLESNFLYVLNSLHNSCYYNKILSSPKLISLFKNYRRDIEHDNKELHDLLTIIYTKGNDYGWEY